MVAAAASDCNVALQVRGPRSVPALGRRIRPLQRGAHRGQYDTLAAYGRERSAMHGDAVSIDQWRQMNAYVDGIPWTDLWWTPAGGGNDEPGTIA